MLKHLPDGRVLGHFEHRTTWNVDPVLLAAPNQVRHFGLFPRSLAQLIGHYDIQELHLTLTRGKWRTSSWGYSPVSSPPGAEFWVWFLPDTQNIDYQWKGVVNGVSGLMCASLNSIDSSSTYQPLLSFRPEGALLGNVSSTLLRYSALPREAVCTENLTPWTKLLPCGQNAGLGSLYVATRLYDSDYHSMGLHVKPVCMDSECNRVRTELHQTLTVVFRPERKEQKIFWSLRSLFTTKLRSHCPLADESKIFVDITGIELSEMKLSPLPSEIIHNFLYGQDTEIAVFDIANLTAQSNLDVSFEWKVPFIPEMKALPLLHVQRYITGSGLERGGLVTEISNLDPVNSLKVVFFDMVPWYLRILLHTRDIDCVHEVNGKSCKDNVVLSQYFMQAKDRQRPYTTELLLSLPPSSKFTLSIQFLRAFLKWNEYPPDASHGFYVNSAVLTTVLSQCLNCSFPPSMMRDKITNHESNLPLRVHTEALLVLLPTPDFSMPYNVICFVSTVIAIGFGSLFNLTTKTLKPEVAKNDSGILQRLLSVLRRSRE